MTTRRERLERKLEKREEWAAGRDRKAAELQKLNEPYRGDIAFNTQPGHIPERARAIRRSEKAAEHYGMARHHEEKAAGLERQLERSIFSDDEDAPERIRERIAELEAERERMKAANTAWRKAGKPDLGTAPGFDPAPYAKYQLANLGGNIGRLRKRLQAIEAQRARSARAEAAGGVVIEGQEWVRITFAEKPARTVLTALKAAGFGWGDGSWVGRRERIPAEVTTGGGCPDCGKPLRPDEHRCLEPGHRHPHDPRKEA